MLGTTKAERYSVTLQNALPNPYYPRFVVARNFEDTFQLSCNLVSACGNMNTGPLAPWKRVQKMQVISTMCLLRTLTERRGVTQLDRLFDRDCDLKRGPFKERGMGRKALRGEHPFLTKTLDLLQNRLDELYPHNDRLDPHEYEYHRIGDYYWQVLWRALATDYSISAVAEKLYFSLDEEASSIFNAHRSDVLSANSDALSDCVFPGLADWDYLAGCIVLLRECKDRGLEDFANKIAGNICQILTIMGVELQDRGIGFQMFSYCCEHILPLGKLEIAPVAMARASALLNSLVLSSYRSKDPNISWGRRRYSMARVLRNEIDPNLLAICDPTQYVDGYPSLAAWQKIHDKSINLRVGRYPPGEWVLNIKELVSAHPQIENWAITKDRKWWDGLGSRNQMAIKPPI